MQFRLRLVGLGKLLQVWRQAHQFNVPLVAVQCPAADGRPAARSFVAVEPAELVVTAIKIHARVGGNLTLILENISTTIRERAKLRREIRVIT